MSLRRNRKVAEYAEEFHRRSARTRTNKSENYQIARFVDGLKEDIHEQLDLQPMATLPAAILMGFKAEMKLEKRQKNGSTSRKRKYLQAHMDGSKSETLTFYESNRKISFQEQEGSQEATFYIQEKWKNHR
ncbi:uncharacterized protein E5676_scaffold119G001460 [Cucumis melo var. makuwa]|uniref:Uncharacterized protein n=1 Tax=Cucumis melo var. makuwa TaxID=1194695 RepID=A0A5D3D505_CUCMM|nr:uncharacterized protein E6C27_scaffold548G001980 [Cucumis melo var. makuwa]TYK18614.1 uncharacterized protein E5676_scaffold119G001460 [Cucumis melo var. makuwa]